MLEIEAHPLRAVDQELHEGSRLLQQSVRRPAAIGAAQLCLEIPVQVLGPDCSAARRAAGRTPQSRAHAPAPRRPPPGARQSCPWSIDYTFWSIIAI